ncbi:MAG TPA: hypothetical protein VFZ61_29040 [Polyangiales bacterium]
MTSSVRTDLVEARARSLCERAAAASWSADSALDWQELAFERMPGATRRAMAALYTDVLFAESFGVELVRRLVERAPEGWLRRFAQLQLEDELRHVRFFTLLVRALGEPVEPAAALVTLRDEIGRSRDHDELLLHAQIIELSAQSVFLANSKRSLRLLSSAVQLPATASVAALLRCIVANVGGDESRHIAFGHGYLRARLGALPAERRLDLARRAGSSAQLMHQAFRERAPHMRRLGFSEPDLAGFFPGIQAQLVKLGVVIADLPCIESEC